MQPLNNNDMNTLEKMAERYGCNVEGSEEGKIITGFYESEDAHMLAEECNGRIGIYEREAGETWKFVTEADEIVVQFDHKENREEYRKDDRDRFFNEALEVFQSEFFDCPEMCETFWQEVSESYNEIDCLSSREVAIIERKRKFICTEQKHTMHDIRGSKEFIIGVLPRKK